MQEGAAEVKQPRGVRACSCAGGSFYGSGKIWEVSSSFLILSFSPDSPPSFLDLYNAVLDLMLVWEMGANVRFAG